MIRLAIPLLCLAIAGPGACKKSAKKAQEEQALADTVPATPERPPRLPETLVLGQVLVELTDPDDLILASQADLARRFGAQLVSSGWLVGAESDVPADRNARRVEALLSIVATIDPPSQDRSGSVAVAVESSLRFVSAAAADMEPRAALIVERPLKSAEPEAARALVGEVLGAALVGAGETLADRVRLQQASDGDVLSVLSQDNPDATLTVWALRLAAGRGLRDAVPVAIAALASPDEYVQAAAIAALVELDDERAVAALSQDVDFKDYESLRVVIEAVSAIGGEEALEFLEFVKSGHEDADIRLRAQQAIGRLNEAGVSKSVNHR